MCIWNWLINHNGVKFAGRNYLRQICDKPHCLTPIISSLLTFCWRSEKIFASWCNFDNTLVRIMSSKVLITHTIARITSYWCLIFLPICFIYEMSSFFQRNLMSFTKFFDSYSTWHGHCLDWIMIGRWEIMFIIYTYILLLLKMNLRIKNRHFLFSISLFFCLLSPSLYFLFVFTFLLYSISHPPILVSSPPSIIHTKVLTTKRKVQKKRWLFRDVPWKYMYVMILNFLITVLLILNILEKISLFSNDYKFLTINFNTCRSFCEWSQK